ncbi:probable inactive receptor kinase At1g48480 [Andrographis paniculata]|uniref:probable inactive receptor kinase At1g48480 n=1 Tax=Andrographis paniculata TaxID=175694 RepID=UPI0021E72C28|nr:probable inactive receptor kinase At1g48480 [Andrographis paniculata]
MAEFSFFFFFTAAAAVLIIGLFPSATPDIISDEAALLAFRSAVDGRTLTWASGTSPCSWPGVKCSPENSSVIELRLPGKSLSGHIPPHTISNIATLRTLSLRSNALSGPLPADLFSSAASFRNVYLQGNFFTGEVPDSLFSHTSIVRLNLADNHLSGDLSPAFNNLTRLKMLYLDNNRFSGSLPNLKIPKLDKFNVSYNNLSGKIPLRLSGKPKSSFIGNHLCGNPLDSCRDDKRLSKGVIIAIIVASTLGFLFIVLLGLCRRRRRVSRNGVSPINEPNRPNKEKGSGHELAETSSSGFPSNRLVVAGDSVSGSGKKELVFFGETRGGFDLEDLLGASAEVLGKGTYGMSYKASLDMGIVVVVKRLREVCVGEEEFRARMELVGRMDHANLAPLKGYYLSRDEKLLVYEYFPMGSLSALLHGVEGPKRTPLNWETRVKIARGLARAILHLHSQGSSVSHGNIKSSNILLTKSYEACVSDFGISQLVLASTTSPHAFSYRAPEVLDPYKISQTADVYSVGVVLLELLTGKAPTHPLINEDGLTLPQWVRAMARDEWIVEVFDVELLRYQNVEEDMIQIMQLAMDCAVEDPDKRPTMIEVTKKIEEVFSWSL